MKLRKSPGDVRKVVHLYEECTSLQTKVDALRQERNTLSKAGNMSKEERQAAGKRVKEELASLEARMTSAKAELEHAGLALPCDTHPDAPVGAEDQARTILTVGAKPAFSFKPRDHIEIGRMLQLFDFPGAAAITGAAFCIMKNDAVLLELALVQWALSRAVAAGFTPIAPPDLAQVSLVEGCGFNPRPTAVSGSSSSSGSGGTDASKSGFLPSQVYSVADSSLALIGTAEIPLAGLHAGQILDPAALPLQYVGISHCFRHEAGSGGARDKGLYRLHQFTKVELFAFVAADAVPDTSTTPLRNSQLDAALTHKPSRPDGKLPPGMSHASEAMFKRLVDLQVSLFTELGLHFRVLDMPTEELGAAAYRKIDIEAWMPCRAAGEGSSEGSGSVGAYGEISSSSNCIDYQSRRLNIRARASAPSTAAAAASATATATGGASGHNLHVHTLNGTAVAIPRVMLALLETHQQADGSVRIPECLQPFMGGKTELRPLDNKLKLR